MTIRRIAWAWSGVLFVALLFLACGLHSRAALPFTIPPKPDRYITDQAGVLDPQTLESINRQLEQFERDTSNQLVVAIYPSLPEGLDLYQYCTFTAQAWAPGQKMRNNGVVLFVFVQSHKLYIAVGRGLEGALPDALANEIRLQTIAPLFRRGDYAGGVQAGVDAIIAATKGEYQGTGSTQARHADQETLPPWLPIVIIIIFIIIISRSRGSLGGPMIFTGGGGGFGGGGFSGGGGGGFSGGGFSGGGGSFGGGGAGGSW